MHQDGVRQQELQEQPEQIGDPGGVGEAHTLQIIARAMTATGRYRIIERFERRERYASTDGAVTRTAVFVDVETTGLDPNRDRIIQLACLPFTYGPLSGRVYAVGACATYLEDPEVPIPAEIAELTGITDCTVAGQRIDDEAVSQMISNAALVVAHNASFDRRFLERRLPVFADKPWACTRDDIPWEAEGFSSTKLEWLAYRQCSMFYDAHRADSDCYMAVHLLTTALPSGCSALSALLESSRRTTVRIWAVEAPFAAKEKLRMRRYRWSAGEDGGPRAWWRDVSGPAANAELAWLRVNVYGGRCPAVVRTFDAHTRYSDRVTPGGPVLE